MEGGGSSLLWKDWSALGSFGLVPQAPAQELIVWAGMICLEEGGREHRRLGYCELFVGKGRENPALSTDHPGNLLASPAEEILLMPKDCRLIIKAYCRRPSLVERRE